MRTYKKVLTGFTLILILVISITIYFTLFEGNDTAVPERGLGECYEAARRVEEGADGGRCHEACTDFEGEPIEENVLKSCLTGNPEEILGG